MKNFTDKITTIAGIAIACALGATSTFAAEAVTAGATATTTPAPASDTKADKKTVAPVLLSATEIETKWSGGNMAKAGMSQAALIGDPTKPGLYVIRLKFPDGHCLAAHSHPDSREITVLKGMWLSGYGDKWDDAKLKELPAGSFYTEPAGVPHFTRTKGETILQVSGMGPSGRNFTHESDCK